MNRLQSAVSIEDLLAIARRKLPRVMLDYLEGGSEDGQTLQWNREAFSRYELFRASCGTSAASI